MSHSALTPEQRAEFRAATLDVAAALLEDVEHIREILVKRDNDDIPPGDLRRLSNILRRMLIENDLRRVAAPRLDGRFMVNAYDNKPKVKEARKNPPRFAMIAGDPLLETEAGPQRTKMITLSIDGFLGQDILCLAGHWVNRHRTIKYSAIVGSGVHSLQPQNEDDRVLVELERRVSFTKNAEGLTVVRYRPTELIGTVPPPFKYDRNAVSPVLLQLLWTADLLVGSHDMKRLEAEIKVDLGLS